MDFNYQIVLFKNRTKKKIINKFKTFKKAQLFYNNLIDESNSVIFPKDFENGKQSSFELGIVERTTGVLSPYFLKDEIGRQVKVSLDDSNFNITKIQPYNIEEEFVDFGEGKKINTPILIKKYLNGDGFKLISKLNNKIVIQNDDKINLFTLKNKLESERFMDILTEHFINKKRTDCLFVKDYSTTQRKYLYDMLVNKGYSKTYLQRHSTTHLSKK